MAFVGIAGGLQQALFIAGNFTAARLHGANGTWPDLDMIPLDANWWLQGNDHVERQDRGQTIATLWMMGRYPLVSAGALPLDNQTLSYLANDDALALNRRGVSEADATLITYEGNCTCTGGQGSCTIPHGPSVPAVAPCVARWAASVRGSTNWTALAMFNLGEAAADTATSFAQLGLPSSHDVSYRVQDVWTRNASNYAGDESFAVLLRQHASALLRITRIV